MLVLLVITHLPKLDKILRSLAWVFISASIIPLIISTTYLLAIHPQTIRQTISQSVGVSASSNYQETVLTLLTNNLTDLGHKIFQGIQLQSIALFAVAIIFFGIAFWWERRNKPSEKEIKEEPIKETAVVQA